MQTAGLLMLFLFMIHKAVMLYNNGDPDGC